MKIDYEYIKCILLFFIVFFLVPIIILLDIGGGSCKDCFSHALIGE